MPNSNIDLITKFSTEAWDTVYKQESVTSLLDSEQSLVKFVGAKTVKVGKYQNGGLSNYYRNNNAGGMGDMRVGSPAGTEKFLGASDFGYQKSGMRLTWEEFTLRCDRAAAFEVEQFDNEESGGELVGLGVTEISRTTIVPEVDAYCLSTIASYALPDGTVTGDFSADGAKPLKALNAAFQYFDEHEVPADDQIIFASPAYMNALRNTSEVTKFLTQEDYRAGKDIRFKVENYEGRMLVTVAPNRLRTDIDLYDGGYTWKSSSKAINFIMCAKSAIMHVVKYEKVKVIGGDANLAARGFDGYTIFARIYHDVFVPDNKRVAIYVNTVESEGDAPAMKLDIQLTKDNKIKSMTTVPGNELCFIGVTSDAAPAVGSKVTAFAKSNIGDTVTTGSKFVAIDSSKKVLAMQTITIG